MTNGLKVISDLIVQSSMREALYANRFESKRAGIKYQNLDAIHVGYRKTLQDEYSLILKFQAQCVCYLSRDPSLQYISDMIKRDNWDSSLEDIQKQDQEFCKVYELLKDSMTQEECKKLEDRHKKLLNPLTSIAASASALKEATAEAQSDIRTRQLLRWLSPHDSTGGYKNAIEERKEGTGNWLLQDNVVYQEWKESSNSLLWLHGKGLTYSSSWQKSFANNVLQLALENLS